MKAVKGKVNPLLTLIFAAVVPIFCTTVVVAQSTMRPPPSPLPRPGDNVIRDGNDRQITSVEEEMRAKRAIKLAEKDHEENLSRAREIEQIGKELREELKNKSNLSRATLKKLERLEKLTKKVRGEAGGGDDDVNLLKRPTDISSAVHQIAEATEALSKNVQNTPRQVVSASVIEQANVLLELIKTLRALAR